MTAPTVEYLLALRSVGMDDRYMLNALKVGRAQEHAQQQQADEGDDNDATTKSDD